jgi:ribose 5-phosphate isomerase B
MSDHFPVSSPTVALASDHAGVEMKRLLAAKLISYHYPMIDLGPNGSESCDYPDYAAKLAEALQQHADYGVLFCGSGIGMSIAANRYPWIRAALCYDVEIARLAREHNDANVLVLGTRIMPSAEIAWQCLQTFLTTAFAEGRHTARVAKLANMLQFNHTGD